MLVGFGEAIGEEIASRKTAIRKRQVGISRDGFLGGFDRYLKPACPVSGKAAQQLLGLWVPIAAGIGLKPQLEGLVRLLQISRHLPVVVEVDEKSFASR